MILKNMLRFLMKRLPPHSIFFNLGKICTRTFLKPEKKKSILSFHFSKATLMADLSEFASNDLYCLDHQFEAKTLSIWKKLSHNADVIMDLGAHVGGFSVISASVNPKAQIFSIEICRKNLRILNHNAQNYKNIKIVDQAIGQTKGSFLFQEDTLSGGGFLSSGIAQAESRVRMESEHSYFVECITLDQLFTQLQLNKIDLMKMDLEGLEHQLLVENSSFWAENGPTHLIVEIGYPKQNPEKKIRILEAMKSNGYTAKRIEGLYAFPWKEKEDLANWHFIKNHDKS
jgi:FkbM family methyltransferase